MEQQVFGCSIQGASHIRSQKECQDSNKKIVKEDYSIIAVADGHGSSSSPFSKTGSQCAVNVFCDIMEETYITYVQQSPGGKEQFLSFLKQEGDLKIAQKIDYEWKRRIYKQHRRLKREVLTFPDGSANKEAIYALYGTTLLGIFLTNDFVYAFQLGDGDITYVDNENVEPVIHADKLLGVETHSLSRKSSWEKSLSNIIMRSGEKRPCMYVLSSDGFANSYISQNEYYKSLQDYLKLIHDNGSHTVMKNLSFWLNETSEEGCGDDITAMFAYFGEV